MREPPEVQKLRRQLDDARREAGRLTVTAMRPNLTPERAELARNLERAAWAKVRLTAKALAHYSGELAIAEIFAAGVAQGWAQCEAAMAAKSHLRLADVTAASVAAIQEAAG